MAKRIPHASLHLQASEQLSALLGAVERNRRLLSAVRALLPAPLDAHCLHASLDKGRLTLDTDSPVWGSRLRFFAPEVQQGLSEDLGKARSCRVRVRPALAAEPPTRSEGAARRLAPETVTRLREAAEHVGEGALADALRALAKAGAAKA